MRVLHLISSRGFYGAENVVFQLCRSLQSLGHEVSIGLFNAHLCPEHSLITKARESGIALVNLRCEGRIRSGAVHALRTTLQSRHIDVLHTHNYKSNAYGYLASRGTGVKLIATCHNWTDTTPALRIYGTLDRMLLSRFDRVVAVSESTAERLRRAHIATNKVSVIGNGVLVPEALPRSTSSGELVIGALTRLSPEKGVDVLLRGAAEILHRGVRARLVVAGDGPERERLLLLSRQLGIAGQVEFRGFVEDVRAYLASLDIFAQPSLADAMPMSVLEAMASGLPVVASAIGGIPELLGNGKRGLLIQPGNHEMLAGHLETLSKDALLRAKLGDAAREYVIQHCSATAMARRYEEIYHAACHAEAAAALTATA